MKKIITLFLTLLILVSFTSIAVSAQRDLSKEEALANELKSLGLFFGVSENDFDLDRAPSRVEAVVMLIRVLGKEQEALSDTWRHPFSDIPEWADKYIGYAYSKGLANGQALDKFGVGEANAAMYLTFVLRALGYNDTTGNDFVWNNPYDLAKKVGILPSTVNLNEFWRADVVLVSHSALQSYLKNSTQTLAQKLIAAGVFTQQKYDSVYNSSIAPSTPSGSKELTAEEVYALCAPSVFYIEIYDKNDKAIATGSGFFIDDKGTAVTNYHVIDEAYSAYIQVSDTEAVYEIAGVYDYSVEEDWAVIKVNCSGNKYLTIGDHSTVVGAATVYALGSPLGLQNTISQGIISNPERKDSDGVNYIQISAAISHGSSGGALLNKYGEVIGITSAGYEEGQNLNLAIPMTYLEGYSKNNVTPLNKLSSGSYEINASTLDMLKAFVKAFYMEIDEDLGYCYYETETDDEGMTYLNSVYYDERDGSICVEVAAQYDETNEIVSYYFFIDGTNSSIAAYYYYDGTDTNYTNATFEGYAKVDVAAFSENYRYSFYEYEGPDKKSNEEVARSMHAIGLAFLEINIFYDKLSEYGSFSVADLGYTSIFE